MKLALVALMLLLAGCGTSDGSSGDDALAGPTATREAAALLTPTPEPQPVRFPEDEGPHDFLTEWWYYTGHLFTEDGERYGFEYVFFQAERGDFPTTYAAHFAITDNPAETFRYDQKLGIDADRGTGEGLDLKLESWEMSSLNGTGCLSADMAGYAINLEFESTKPPVLHNGIGYFDFPDAGSTYYYSQTALDIGGTLTVDGETLEVTGEAWTDHQWGNFIVTAEAGWDWFSLQLDGDRELMLFLIRDPEQTTVYALATIVHPDGSTTHLGQDEFTVDPTGEWTSPETDATYPLGWAIELPNEDWSLAIEPVFPEQELDTTETTGIIYWEGEVEVSGTVEGQPVAGLGYVELTGYATPFVIAP